MMKSCELLRSSEQRNLEGLNDNLLNSGKIIE